MIYILTANYRNQANHISDGEDKFSETTAQYLRRWLKKRN